MRVLMTEYRGILSGLLAMNKRVIARELRCAIRDFLCGCVSAFPASKTNEAKVNRKNTAVEPLRSLHRYFREYETSRQYKRARRNPKMARVERVINAAAEKKEQIQRKESEERVVGRERS